MIQMQNLKEIYNITLKRYYDGCDYLFQHSEEWDKYLKVVMELLKKINLIISKIPNMTQEEILNGFK